MPTDPDSDSSSRTGGRLGAWGAPEAFISPYGPVDRQPSWRARSDAIHLRRGLIDKIRQDVRDLAAGLISWSGSDTQLADRVVRLVGAIDDVTGDRLPGSDHLGPIGSTRDERWQSGAHGLASISEMSRISDALDVDLARHRSLLNWLSSQLNSLASTPEGASLGVAILRSSALRSASETLPVLRSICNRQTGEIDGVPFFGVHGNDEVSDAFVERGTRARVAMHRAIVARDQSLSAIVINSSVAKGLADAWSELRDREPTFGESSDDSEDAELLEAALRAANGVDLEAVRNLATAEWTGSQYPTLLMAAQQGGSPAFEKHRQLLASVDELKRIGVDGDVPNTLRRMIYQEIQGSLDSTDDVALGARRSVFIKWVLDPRTDLGLLHSAFRSTPLWPAIEERLVAVRSADKAWTSGVPNDVLTWVNELPPPEPWNPRRTTSGDESWFVDQIASTEAELGRVRSELPPTAQLLCLVEALKQIGGHSADARILLESLGTTDVTIGSFHPWSGHPLPVETGRRLAETPIEALGAWVRAREAVGSDVLRDMERLGRIEGPGMHHRYNLLFSDPSSHLRALEVDLDHLDDLTVVSPLADPMRRFVDRVQADFVALLRSDSGKPVETVILELIEDNDLRRGVLRMIASTEVAPYLTLRLLQQRRQIPDEFVSGLKSPSRRDDPASLRLVGEIANECDVIRLELAARQRELLALNSALNQVFGDSADSLAVDRDESTTDELVSLGRHPDLGRALEAARTALPPALGGTEQTDDGASGIDPSEELLSTGETSASHEFSSAVILSTVTREASGLLSALRDANEAHRVLISGMTELVRRTGSTSIAAAMTQAYQARSTSPDPAVLAALTTVSSAVSSRNDTPWVSAFQVHDSISDPPRSPNSPRRGVRRTRPRRYRLPGVTSSPPLARDHSDEGPDSPSLLAGRGQDKSRTTADAMEHLDSGDLYAGAETDHSAAEIDFGTGDGPVVGLD